MDKIKNLNDISLNSFFQERIIDNNGVSVTDINLGLMNLFRNYNDEANRFESTERFFVSDIEAGYPDLIAKKSILQDQQFWWWVTLLNRLENPMTDFKAGWIYSVTDINQVLDFINLTNENISSNNNTRIGKVIELN